jgi:hypothetical protein
MGVPNSQTWAARILLEITFHNQRLEREEILERGSPGEALVNVVFLPIRGNRPSRHQLSGRNIDDNNEGKY